MKFYLKSAWNFIERNGRSKELRLLAFAIFIAVVSITSMVFLVQAIQTEVEAKTDKLLGSDRAITSPTPIDSSVIEETKKLNLKTTMTINFLSMLAHQDELALAQVRAIGESYPLRGALQVATELLGTEQLISKPPEPGTVWLEPRLFSLLDIKVGDAITIGAASFKVTRVLTADPDKNIQGNGLEPWALINEQDVPATEIIQPGSRVNYTLFIIGKEQALAQLEGRLKPKLNAAQKWIDTRHSRPLVNRVVENVNHYIGLIFLVNVSLAGIAIWMVMHRFSRKQFDAVAIMGCLGATQRWIFAYYGLGLILLAFMVGILGMVVGYGMKALFIYGFAQEGLTEAIQTTSLKGPIALGFLTILVLLGGFAFPPLSTLRKITPFRVLRRDLPPPTISHFLSPGIALGGVMLLIILQTQNIQLVLPLILLTLMVSFILWALIYWLLKSLSHIKHYLNMSLRFNIENMTRRAGANALQVFSFSLVLGLLATLYLIRSELIRTWHNEVSPFAPNYFVLNIPTSELQRFQTFLKEERSIQYQTPYPMIAGRLLAVNQESVSMDEKALPNRRVLNRLLNLTWASMLPVDNKIIEGEWFGEQDQGASVSIEEGFAERLQIKLKDKLKLQIAEKVFEPTVTSVRKVNWNSFQPNFFVIFSPGIIDKLPATYMTSFYLPSTHISLLKKLVQNFPMISIIDIQMILNQLRVFVRAISAVIEYLWGFTLIISLILLFAAIRSTLDERQEEASLFRILGVSNQRLRSILLSEFLLLGCLAGIMGWIIANILMYWLSSKIFGFSYRFDWIVFSGLPLLGMLLIGIAGWFGTRRILLKPPLQVLQAA